MSSITPSKAIWHTFTCLPAPPFSSTQALNNSTPCSFLPHPHNNNMAPPPLPLLFASLLFLSLSPHLALAADPDPLLDFCVATPTQPSSFNGLACKSPANVTSSDFLSDILSKAGNVSNPLGLSLALAAGATFPGLNTQGLTVVRIDLAKDGFVPPHIHPRASEVLFVVEGEQLVGFIDSSDNLFAATVKAGEIFVFPRGLVHYQLNVGNSTAFSLSSLNSQSPGLSLVASALFASNPSIPNVVLEKTFQLTAKQVNHIKRAFHH